MYAIERPCSAIDVITEIKRNFNFTYVPKDRIKEAIKTLEEKKAIIRTINDTLKLSDNIKKEAEKSLKTIRKIKNRAEALFINILKKRLKELSKDEERRYVETFYEFLGALLAQQGFSLARTIATLIPLGKITMKDIDKLKKLMASITIDLDESAKGVFLKSISMFLEEAQRDSDIAEFIHLLVRTYYLVELLNIDPDIKMLQKDSLGNITLYLDTNIVISLLCEEDIAHNEVKEIIELTKKIGVQDIRISKETKKEFLRRLKISDENYRAYDSYISSSIAKKFKTLMKDDVLIRTYWKRKAENVYYDWDLYMAEMKSFDSILSNKYGIKISDDAYTPDAEEVKELQSLFVEMAGKDKFKAHHDAFNIILVQYLRKKNKDYEILGPKYWFLTRDHTLPLIESAFNIARGAINFLGEYVPSSIHIVTWYEIITPFIGPEISEKDSAKLFARILKAHLHMPEEKVDSQSVIKLLSILGPYADDPAIDVLTLKKMLGERKVRELINKVTKTTSMKQLEYIRKELISHIEKNIKRKYDKRIKALERQLVSLRLVLCALVLTVIALIVYFTGILGLEAFLVLLLAPIVNKVIDWLDKYIEEYRKRSRSSQV